VNNHLQNLRNHDAVDGVVIVGSAATGHVSSSSDLDMVIVLSSSPVLLDVGIAEIDSRVTDLLFVRSDELSEIPMAGRSGTPTPRQV
jgi:predicted nucleotidyltransferase